MLDEPLAEHGEIGKGRADDRVCNTNSNHVLNNASYIMRRLARDGAEDASRCLPKKRRRGWMLEDRKKVWQVCHRLTKVKHEIKPPQLLEFLARCEAGKFISRTTIQALSNAIAYY